MALRAALHLVAELMVPQAREPTCATIVNPSRPGRFETLGSELRSSHCGEARRFNGIGHRQCDLNLRADIGRRGRSQNRLRGAGSGRVGYVGVPRTRRHVLQMQPNICYHMTACLLAFTRFQVKARAVIMVAAPKTLSVEARAAVDPAALSDSAQGGAAPAHTRGKGVPPRRSNCWASHVRCEAKRDFDVPTVRPRPMDSSRGRFK